VQKADGGGKGTIVERKKNKFQAVGKKRVLEKEKKSKISVDEEY